VETQTIDHREWDKSHLICFGIKYGYFANVTRSRGRRRHAFLTLRLQYLSGEEGNEDFEVRLRMEFERNGGYGNLV